MQYEKALEQAVEQEESVEPMQYVEGSEDEDDEAEDEDEEEEVSTCLSLCFQCNTGCLRGSSKRSHDRSCIPVLGGQT